MTIVNDKKYEWNEMKLNGMNTQLWNNNNNKKQSNEWMNQWNKIENKNKEFCFSCRKNNQKKRIQKNNGCSDNKLVIIILAIKLKNFLLDKWNWKNWSKKRMMINEWMNGCFPFIHWNIETLDHHLISFFYMWFDVCFVISICLFVCLFLLFSNRKKP